MESPVSTPAPPPLHLLAAGINSNISSPCEQIMVRTRSVGVNTCDVALVTEPECLGPCEPGTSVNLEGIVWQETEDGMLVVNVTWRNKTYVGTLLDCTRHDWAPPRFCESPTSDLEMRNGRGRSKRMRPLINIPVSENSVTPDMKNSINKTRTAANSKGRRGSQNSSDRRTPPNSTAEDVKASPSLVNKRKNKAASDMEPNSSSEDCKGSKRVRTNSNSSAPQLGALKVEPSVLDRNCPSPILIDCPHPNCKKKYKHINGLRYHQAHAHTDEECKLEGDVDSEYGEDSLLPSETGSCNGAVISQKDSVSPGRCVTPKVRALEVHSPSPSAKCSTKNLAKKKVLEGDTDSGGIFNEGSDEGPCLADDTSNDGEDSLGVLLLEKDQSKKMGGAKPEKLLQKSLKAARPIAPAIPPHPMYIPTATFTTASPGSSSGLTTTVVQPMPKSPQLKPIQPKPTVMGEPSTVNPALTPTKEKKKKEKKKKETKDMEGLIPQVKGAKPEDGRSPFRDTSGDLNIKSETLLNGSSDSHHSRLASMKAEADKIYSFTDNAPSPSIGVSSRLEAGNLGQPMTPLHIATQNGADSGSVKTNSPAYSDISDAGEDGEGKSDSLKTKDSEQVGKEGAKKALFPSQTPNKESPYYPSFESYYSPSYAQPSPGGTNSAVQQGGDVQATKVRKEEEQDSTEVKVKTDISDDKKVDIGNSSQQPSVIQQRSNAYMQSLYYNQYAYVPPYSYSEQGYHAHLMSNPAYRQQYEEQQKQRQVLEQHQQHPQQQHHQPQPQQHQQQQHHQQQQQQQQQHHHQQQRGMDKKLELGMKDREVGIREEWKQKASVPPTLTKAPSLTDLAKPIAAKPKDSSTELAKSVIIPKLDDPAKGHAQQSEGLKSKHSECVHLGKETSEVKLGVESARQTGIDPAMWYRQEADARMWSYVYPSKYSDVQKAEDERWKDERERKVKEDRSRSKEGTSKEEGKESTSTDPRPSSTEECRQMGKDSRTNVHVPVSSPLTQHQSYVPYMHGYPYSQTYDPNHPAYRGMPSVLMQNYPAPYLPQGYAFSPFGAKVSGNEDGEKARSSPSMSSKPGSESKALDLIQQQHASHYKSKSPTTSEKVGQDRDRGGGGDRGAERPRSSSSSSSTSQRLIPSHHLGYSLITPGQYDLAYAAGLSSPAIVASQQNSAPSLYPPTRR
ncbi:zinc finger protein 609 isoform X2 [Protopterus annectens]|uniref:zinc finger protein 609 isoform X2 n=1 Tax=Protopterus annectens TaxID=7888 RepID=UPI001CF9AE4F|nr:zinc finger protein 609 isoform X2 [Protopterus annectens]